MLFRPSRLCSLSALMVALNGVSNIMSVWLIHHPTRLALLKHYLPVLVLRGSWLTAAMAGSMQLFLGWSLGKRKKQAWLVTIAVLFISTGAQLLRGLYYGQATVNFALLLLLLALKPCFTAASDPPSVRRGVQVFLTTFVFTCLYGITGFYLLDRHFHQSFNLADATRQTLSFLFWVTTPELGRPSVLARWFLDSLAIIEAGGIVFSLYSLLRPVLYRRTVVAAEMEKARSILQQFGRSSLAHLTLLTDKYYYFSHSTKSFVAYTLIGNVAVVLGDPVGPEEDATHLVGDFKNMCEKNDWHPVFYQVLPDYLAVYQAAGFKFLKIGEEAVIELAEFSLEGGKRKNLRQSVNRTLRRGYTTKLLLPPQSDEILAQLKEVSDQWLKQRQGREKRFSLGWFDPAYLRPCPVMTVKDSRGQNVAFANLIPEYRRNEGTIDLMRYRDDVSGLMDLLFVRLIEYFREAGYETFNMGLSPLSGVGNGPEDGARERAIRLFYNHFNQFYSFKGLRQYKEKFGPRWEPRYLIYSSTLALPKIAVAIISANAGGRLSIYLDAWFEKLRNC